jgi:asparagine synthase (glutamine-hydrolysing)
MAIARAMADRLTHRGPDDAAQWSDAKAGVSFGFRRLSIIDLSPAGRQPMVSACGNFVMMFNGEIYNHRALRAELDAGGNGQWRGHSDGETLLAAIARWGFVATLERLNGMFAIAVWDRLARRLWLARDRFGEKPLYYGTQQGAFLFASELKALTAHPAWTGNIDRAALGLFLRYDYIPSPWSAYDGIRKLSPGYYLSVGVSGEIERLAPYWSAAERAVTAAATPFAGGHAAAVEALAALVDDAVNLRLESDVPLGAFLSGGIDSSTVVAAMEATSPGTVRTFTIGFPDTRYDESREAAAVAAHLGTEHRGLAVSEEDCRAVLPDLVGMYDEPFADPSQIPTALLCRLARDHVTVSLTGDGGDELFGGYSRYARAASSWAQLSRMPSPWRNAARGVARGLGGYEARLPRRLRKLVAAWGHDDALSLYRDRVSRWREGDGLAYGLPQPQTGFDGPLAGELPSLEQSLMLLDAQTYLPDDLLVKMDRASMAVGLETRAPLLDHRIAEFAWSLPPALAVEGGPKQLLREVLLRRVPRSLVERPKQGFEPPLGRWLRDGLRDWADDLLDVARLRRHGLVVAETVARRWAEHRSGRRNWTYSLWSMLTLEAWLDQHETIPASPPAVLRAS